MERGHPRIGVLLEHIPKLVVVATTCGAAVLIGCATRSRLNLSLDLN